MTSSALSDLERKAIHDLALEARELLTREARELLEGTYGLYSNGRLDPPEKLPQVGTDPETTETYRRLGQFLDDEQRASLPRPEAVDRLVKEVAFTHLNRLVAFKMMEARKLIRGTVDKGTESNGFKFYLADPEHADDYAFFQSGDVETAYRHFLLWQSAQIVTQVRVLFDPDTLPSRLFPRPPALHSLLAMLNRPGLADAWQADEAIGWIYQYFSEPEREEWGQRKGEKVPSEIVPLKTQLYTPHWVVRVLVQNTLGRLWVQMHPDSRLLGTELLDYLVPLQGEIAPEPLQPVREITLLDPACGTMHFGLVAFDLFAAMYQEELDRAGQPGWPEAPSVADSADIAAAIIGSNLFGIDIDLRAVQLSALALYLKAKSLNPTARITDSNLACADVRPLNGARLGAFLSESRFTRPVYERLIRALWTRLQEVIHLGSLLRLDREIGELIAEERARYEEMPLFAGVSGEFEREAAEEEFWQIISAQILQGLDEFASQQAKAGKDQTFFASEAFKGLRLQHLLLRRYDVVVTNPPFLSARDHNASLKQLLGRDYPHSKSNLYSAFAERCLELLAKGGRLGILTGQSFMFTSYFAKFREQMLDAVVVETLLQFDYHLFADARMDTACYVLRLEPTTMQRMAHIGTYFRLVHPQSSESKREAFEQALVNGRAYHVAQGRFNAIPRSPWVYWTSRAIRTLFERNQSLVDIAKPCIGAATSDNFRFVRMWHEVGLESVKLDCQSHDQALCSRERWFPYMKGGGFRRWYGLQTHVVDWADDGRAMKEFANAKRLKFSPNATGNLWSAKINSHDYYFREGVTYSYLTSGQFSARLSPGGFIFDVAGSTVFGDDPLFVMAMLNSRLIRYCLNLLNPTVNFQISDLSRIPVSKHRDTRLRRLVKGAISLSRVFDCRDEATRDFIVPPCWSIGLDELLDVELQIAKLEHRIDSGVYKLYGINDEDRAAIEAELAGQPLVAEEDEEAMGTAESDDETEEAEAPITRQEHAVRWISYAVGVVLRRFEPGTAGRLGSAVFRSTDFAVGSLPEPEAAEFDQLIGPPERFAYADDEGGRHIFPAEVEVGLRDLAVPDGITVLDEGHPRDLPALVERALYLMIGDESAREVVAEGAGGDLRKFLERGFFANWHFKWYRKRPAYWPLQSARRGYGFVLFHERVDKNTPYILQRDYLDHKLNGLRLEIGDLQIRAEGLSGAARKRVERQIDQTAQLLDEINEFSQTMARIVREGYEPEPNWIDDGVILRLAPLWELIPIWKAEPKKYWGRLQKGQYDWSHIAMRYWPARVKEACKANKSFAIAHGHEVWYEGK